MKIKGFIGTSLIDWDGKVVCTIFTGNCNFRCPFCHNVELVLHAENLSNIPEKEIIEFMQKHSDMLDGICITGGEPTLYSDLSEFCKKIKEIEMFVKLDTNGTNPHMLSHLIETKLIDYVAMDVKAPLNKEKYSEACGIDIEQFFEKVKESISILLNSTIDYEFRTTVVPEMHTAQDIEEIARSLKGASRYVLQKFEPTKTLKPELEKLKTQSDEEMDSLVELVEKYVQKAKWRGKQTWYSQKKK